MSIQRAKEVAREAYEVNRIFCSVMGDGTRPEWENISEENRNQFVTEVLEISAFPDMTFEKYCEDRFCAMGRSGWKHGPIENAEIKEHPYMLPYAQLPQKRQIKEQVFYLVVRAGFDNWK